MEGIQVSIDKVDLATDTFLIKVGGYVDTTTSQELDRTLEELLKKDIVRIIIDLEDVDYISSAGWGIFISEIKTIRHKGGDIKLVKMSPDVLEVFELLEFHRILRSYNSIDDAMSDFQQNSTRMRRAVGVEGVSREILMGDITKTPSLGEAEDDPTTLPLEEKIKQIIQKNPEYGPRGVQKALLTGNYGEVRIGLIRIYWMLRHLGLHSLKKRVIFSRSV